MTSVQRFYVYIIFAGDKPLYVGKGTGTRCMQHLERADMAHVQELSIKVRYQESEEEALNLEADLIRAIGIHNLLNKHVPRPSTNASVIEDALSWLRFKSQVKNAETWAWEMRTSAAEARIRYNCQDGYHPAVAKRAAMLLAEIKLGEAVGKSDDSWEARATIAGVKRSLRKKARDDDFVLAKFLDYVADHPTECEEVYIRAWNAAGCCGTSYIPRWVVDRMPTKERMTVTKARSFYDMMRSDVARRYA